MKYVIPDEPKPGKFEQAIVNPIWPLFSIMIAGAWLAWPWFLLNSFALGSPTKRSELFALLCGFLCVSSMSFGLAYIADQYHFSGSAIKLMALAIVAVKLIVSYYVFLKQSQAHELWEYYGRKNKSMMVGLLVLGFVGKAWVIERFSHSFWILVVS